MPGIAVPAMASVASSRLAVQGAAGEKALFPSTDIASLLVTASFAATSATTLPSSAAPAPAIGVDQNPTILMQRPSPATTPPMTAIDQDPISVDGPSRTVTAPVTGVDQDSIITVAGDGTHPDEGIAGRPVHARPDLPVSPATASTPPSDMGDRKTANPNAPTQASVDAARCETIMPRRLIARPASPSMTSTPVGPTSPSDAPSPPTTGETESAPARPALTSKTRRINEAPPIEVTSAPAAPIILVAQVAMPPAAPPAAEIRPESAAASETQDRSKAATASSAAPLPTPAVHLSATTDQQPIMIGDGDLQTEVTTDNTATTDAAPTKTDLPTLRDDAPAFVPTATPSSPVAARTQPIPVGIVTAQPGRIGQELGIAIARHVVRRDPAAGATGGGEIITLRLNPVEMGRIEVKLSLNDRGTLRALVSADNFAALDMLRRDSVDLGRALADAGVRADAESLRFDTRAGNGGGGGQSWQRHSEPGGSARTNVHADTPEDITPAYRPLRTRGRVDISA